MNDLLDFFFAQEEMFLCGKIPVVCAYGNDLTVENQCDSLEIRSCNIGWDYTGQSNGGICLLFK